MNRRNLLGGITAALFGSKLNRAAGYDSAAPLDLKWSLLQTSVQSKVAISEVFYKNIPQLIKKSTDTSIINLDCKTIGVSIYVDPSGLFLNEVS